MAPRKANQVSLPEVSLSSIIEKKAYGTETDLVPRISDTGDEVVLRVEKDAKPRVSSKKIGEIALLGSQYFEDTQELSAVKDRVSDGETAIKGLFSHIRGLRGLQSEEDGYRLRVDRHDSIRWNADVLRTVLKGAYSSVVRETGIVSVQVPPEISAKKGSLTAQKIHDAIRKTLRAEGMDEETIDKTVSFTVIADADEKKLDELINQRKLRLPRRAAQVTSHLAVSVAPYHPPKK